MAGPEGAGGPASQEPWHRRGTDAPDPVSQGRQTRQKGLTCRGGHVPFLAARRHTRSQANKKRFRFEIGLDLIYVVSDSVRAAGHLTEAALNHFF